MATKLPHALIVNLQRRPDRWEECRQRLNDLGGALSFERAEAVDGSSEHIPSEVVRHRWSTARNWRYVTNIFEGGKDCGYEAVELDLTVGERGCAASHVVLWRRVAASTEPYVILEDDAKFLPKFVDRTQRALKQLVNAGEKPDILYLGYSQAAPWRRKVGSAVNEAEYLWTTVGYILWPLGAKKLLAALPVDQPVDNFMAALTSGRVMRGFAVVPEVVEQAKPWNVDSDVPHSDDVAWQQNR